MRRVSLQFVLTLVMVWVCPHTKAEEEERELSAAQRKAAEAYRERQNNPPTPAEAVNAMVAAERKFYQTGQEQGTRAAFLSFLADNGIVFRPGPVNGKQSWTERAESGLDLVWEPTFAVMARSADFGYDTGPAKWRPNKNEKNFSGYGQFVSIWRRQMDGSWKVEVDCGIDNPKPPEKKETLRTVVPERNAKIDVATSGPAFRTAQNAFVSLAKLDFVKALREFGSDQVRLYRDGELPAIGKDAGAELLGPEQAGETMEIMSGAMSSTGDLAYYYGKYTDGRTAGGHFLQIWQTNNAGAWKLVLDWHKLRPIPR
ncbi:MAG TPA: nuclear transport factor 2 family protein [Chthoniobacterales bacterium]|nr:nuclear transport factor 2 family protein [Chthoniobacterales bacterium]